MNQATAKSSLEKHNGPPCNATTFINNQSLPEEAWLKKPTSLKKYFYIQQKSLPGFKSKRKNWAFILKALECGYLNTGQLDVVRYKPGETVTHEEDHHVPPERHMPKFRAQNDFLPKTNQ